MANRRFVPQRVCRPTFWEGSVVNQTVTTGAAVFSTAVTEAELENVPNPTLVRCRGSLLVQLSSSAATPGASIVVLGIKVVTRAAFAAGGVPLPFTDVGSDWIWWQAIPMNILAGNTPAPTPEDTTTVHRVEVDSKAMRKISPNEVLVFVSENVVVTSTQTFDVDGAIRYLFKR